MIATFVSFAALTSTLKLDLRIGDRWTYRIEQSFLPLDSTNFEEDEDRFTYQFKVRMSAPGSSGFDLESTSRLIAHRFGGENLPGAKEGPDLVERFTLEANGCLKKSFERYSNPNEFRLSRLTWFGVPKESNSDAWEAEWPVVGNDWVCPAKANYKLIGKTQRLNRNCSLIEFQFYELDVNPMAAQGRMEIDDQTGIVMAADVKAKNAPLPGGMEPHRLAVKLEVTELKLKKR